MRSSPLQVITDDLLGALPSYVRTGNHQWARLPQSLFPPPSQSCFSFAMQPEAVQNLVPYTAALLMGFSLPSCICMIGLSFSFSTALILPRGNFI